MLGGVRLFFLEQEAFARPAALPVLLVFPSPAASFGSVPLKLDASYVPTTVLDGQYTPTVELTGKAQ